MMNVTKIKVSQVDRQRKKRAQHADGVTTVKGEISQEQNRAESAAFPKSDRNNTFTCALGGDPLNDKARAKDDVAGPAHDFPSVDRETEKRGVGQQVKAIHSGELFPKMWQAETKIPLLGRGKVFA